SSLLHKLGNRRDSDKTFVNPPINRIERREIGSVELFSRIDLRTKFLIGNDPVVRRIIAGREDRAVDIGRAGIGRVIIFEEDTRAGERLKSGGVFRRAEVWAHS